MIGNQFADACSSFDEAEFVIYGVPFDATSSFRTGSKWAPLEMRKASYNFETYNGDLDVDMCDVPVHDMGDCEVYADVDATLDVVYDTASTIVKAGKIPVMIKRIAGTDGTVKYRSNVIVSASSAMLDPSAIQNTSISDGEYLLNIFKSLSDRTDFVNIQPKSLAGNTLSVSTSEASLIGILLAGVLPLAILAAGIVIWLSRRYK
jgi:hypothetical protein